MSNYDIMKESTTSTYTKNLYSNYSGTPVIDEKCLI